MRVSIRKRYRSKVKGDMEALDAALRRVEKGAKPEWLSAANRVLMKLAKRQPYLTSDDVWRELQEAKVYTDEPRALGAVVRAAARQKTISKTGRYIPSERDRCHSREIAVWRSNIYNR